MLELWNDGGGRGGRGGMLESGETGGRHAHSHFRQQHFDNPSSNQGGAAQRNSAATSSRRQIGFDLRFADLPHKERVKRQKVKRGGAGTRPRDNRPHPAERYDSILASQISWARRWSSWTRAPKYSSCSFVIW
jgi:hypothetical protein